MHLFVCMTIVNVIWYHILQVEMGFLMVGHTHEDIDQGFSCLSRYLQKVDALTVTGN